MYPYPALRRKISRHDDFQVGKFLAMKYSPFKALEQSKQFPRLEKSIL